MGVQELPKVGVQQWQRLPYAITCTSALKSEGSIHHIPRSSRWFLLGHARGLQDFFPILI